MRTAARKARLCLAGKHCYELAISGLAHHRFRARCIASTPHFASLLQQVGPQQHLCATKMAKARTVQQRHGDAVDVHYDDMKEEDAEETLDESADPLEESGHTVDTSDEEVDENVADEMARFEDSFVGIDKRYRLINRIGEGEWRNWLVLCRAAS